jgi:hypothetical protein
MSVYLELFNNRTDVEQSYEVELSDNIEIILAWYEYESYSGCSIVIYRDKEDGKLYEVNASHCSCYGLEGQWIPEETTLEALKMRVFNEEIQPHFNLFLHKLEFQKEIDEIYSKENIHSRFKGVKFIP